MHNRKGNVSFNDALNTFYLQLYGIGHMVKKHIPIVIKKPSATIEWAILSN